MDQEASISTQLEKTDTCSNESSMQVTAIPASCNDAGVLNKSVDSGIHDVETRTQVETGTDGETPISTADDNFDTNIKNTVEVTTVKETAVIKNTEKGVLPKDMTENSDKKDNEGRNVSVGLIEKESSDENSGIHNEAVITKNDETSKESVNVTIDHFDTIQSEKSKDTNKGMDVEEKKQADVEIDNETLVDSSGNVMMEYRTVKKVIAGDGSSDSSPDSDSEPETANDKAIEAKDTEAQLNKIISNQRDASPEREKRVKLNRYGFEDIRTKGELLPEDLPPLEELTITVDESVVLVEVGSIKSIVGILVVIQSNENVPPLNDETILFVEGHKVLGQVFEVFGPVKTPWYSVRFNEVNNIEAKGLKVGMPVFCAPREDSFTKFVFVDSLKTIRGSDASWEDNNEPPEKHLDYSDDEAERRAKAKRRNKKFGDTEAENGEDSAVHKKNPRQRNRNRPNRDEQSGNRPEQQIQHPKRGWNPFKDIQNGHGNSGPPRYGGRHQANENFSNSNRQRWPSGQNNFNRSQSRFGGPPDFQNRPRMGQNQGQPQYGGRNIRQQNSWRPPMNTNFPNNMQNSGQVSMNSQSPSNRPFNIQGPPPPMGTPGFGQSQGQSAPQAPMNVDFSQPPPQFQSGNPVRQSNQPAGVNPWMGSQVSMTPPFVASKITNPNNQSFLQGNQSISHHQMNAGNQMFNQGQPVNNSASFQSNQSNITQTGNTPLQSSVGNAPNFSMNNRQNTFNQPLQSNFQTNHSPFQTNNFSGQSNFNSSNEPGQGGLNVTNFTPPVNTSFQFGGMNPLSCNSQPPNVHRPELSNFQMPNVQGQTGLSVQNNENTNLVHNQNFINNQQQGVSQGPVQSTSSSNQFVPPQGYGYQSNFVGQSQPAGQGGFIPTTGGSYPYSGNNLVPNGSNHGSYQMSSNVPPNVVTDQRFIQNNNS
ncbi:H/ACA ribonucleoprotein complex non-core subunit NAF1-like [Ruditapes philippinarum]|uniref:H/ACA ribonucleoprotein complex non-core subunit NAF1-like n=1 Tax=Ruditapes philippinarum TaxID=129788 RepID=UPI00295BBF5D|nr:H/ACA ribonucleoprotein complex non-core subunit NAF1-like [Ruditapes philippinarum]